MGKNKSVRPCLPCNTLSPARPPLEGTSLHTGQKVSLTLRPAPEGHGFKFRRVDLPDQPFISADVEKVQTVERATTLAEGSVKVHTVEHVISALTGMGVDNAIIEMDANEPPIGDGSSRPFVELIKKVGLVAQSAPRRVWEIREPIHHETADGTIITIVPCKTFKVSVTNVGPEGRFTQYFSTEVNPETYEREIASARTFVYYEDVKPLLEKGLIKGGSLESAVVIRGNEIMSKEPMRFTNEFARHKALDIIGDLMLAGVRIIGHVIAVKPGHGPNTKMAAKLKSEYLRMRSMVPADVILPTGESVLDINEVLRILPHRYPFLMVDRIVDCFSETKCTGDEEHHDQRALLRRPLPRPSDHAWRAPARSDGAGFLGPHAPQAGKHRKNRLFHECGPRQMAPPRVAGRYAFHRNARFSKCAAPSAKPAAAASSMARWCPRPSSNSPCLIVDARGGGARKSFHPHRRFTRISSYPG
jgi:UDP-3-O-[3-hydroxymyristoyl] N-acetylglucosamine deacetylase / 3-hydroxyacyl-[acyl-carrier-protein] dehydratase